jgi:hypothetical protein
VENRRLRTKCCDRCYFLEAHPTTFGGGHSRTLQFPKSAPIRPAASSRVDPKRLELLVLAGRTEPHSLQLSGYHADGRRPHDGRGCHEIRIVQVREVLIKFLRGNISAINQSSAKLPAIPEMFAPCIAIQYPTKPRAAPATAGGFPHPKSPNPRFFASHCSLPLASLRA